MYLGRIVEEGPAHEIVRNPQHPYTRALMSVVPKPDPRAGTQPQILQGETPNPIDVPAGCRFHPRCPVAIRCRVIDPELRSPTGARAGHEAACIRALSASPGNAHHAASPEEALVDLILTGGTVFTADRSMRVAEAVGIRGGRIAAVGSAGEVMAEAGPGTRVVELDGRTVVPGFQDARVRAAHGGLAGHAVLPLRGGLRRGVPRDRGSVRRPAPRSGVDLRRWLADVPLPGRHADEGAARLDIVPDRPVFLLNRDVHGAWANSKALEAGHITRETADPWDGRIQRDSATGEPTGTLHEGAAYSFVGCPPPPAAAGGVGSGRTYFAAAAARPRDHRVAGRWVTPATEDDLPLARRARRAHRPGGRGALVGAGTAASSRSVSSPRGGIAGSVGGSIRRP